MTTPTPSTDSGEFVSPSLPTVRRKPPAPLSDDEALLAEVFALLMEIDDTNRLDPQTVAMVERLPWEHVRLLRDQLAAVAE